MKFQNAYACRVIVVTRSVGVKLQQSCIVGGYEHRWELPCNYPVFTVVMVIYHYVERIWRILVTPIF